VGHYSNEASQFIVTLAAQHISSSYLQFISSSWAASKHIAATWKFIFHWDCHQVTLVIPFFHWDLHLIATCHWNLPWDCLPFSYLYEPWALIVNHRTSYWAGGDSAGFCIQHSY